MTSGDFLIKWSAYLLALIPIYIAEFCVTCYLPVFGVIPMLLPLAAVAVAVLEGSVAGAGYSLAVGILCDTMYPGIPGGWIIGLTLLGIMAGILAQYRLHQNLVGCLLCALLALGIIDLLRIASRLLRGSASFSAMLAVAVPEILYSAVFVFPLYGLFLWIFIRVPKRTVL